MRTFVLPSTVKRISKRRNRWIVRIPSGEEQNRIQNYMGYVGNDPFWFDGGSDGSIDPPVFVGLGDGRRTQFYLPHKSVFAPSLVVHVNERVEANWALQEDSGLLTFNVPPPPRSRIKAKYRCRYKCIAFQRDGRTIEIREVEPLRSDGPGRATNSAAARYIIADFLNFKPGSKITQDSSLYWLLYGQTNAGEIKLLQHCLRDILEPVIDPKPIHDPRASRHLATLAHGKVLARCPKTELRLDLERLIQRALVDGKFQRLRTCKTCSNAFVASHGLARVCSGICASRRDKQQHKLRQRRYYQTKRMAETKSQQLKAKKAEVKLFEKFMRKSFGSPQEEKEIWPIARRVPRRWKAITEWGKQMKDGVPAEEIWNGLSSDLRKLLFEMLSQQFNNRA
jgi:hypothetical protein